MLRNSLLATSLLAVYACGPTTTEIPEIPATSGGTSAGGSAATTAGTGATTGGTGATTGGTGATTGGTGGSGGSSTPLGGSGGTTPDTGGTGGTDAVAGSGGSGGQVVDPNDPYAPRSGPFSMLVLTRTGGYRHQGSINTGLEMLQEIAAEQGFEIVRADLEDQGQAPPAGPRVPINEIVTPEGLAQFEIVFHLNTTGDLLNNEQQAVYEEWMTGSNGAYVGTHSATDTENGWAFYSEVSGQYYNGHGPQNEPDQLQLEDAADTFVGTQGLPNPWQRNEEWYRFNNHQEWTAKPGFTVLGRKAADGQPCMWTREWGNFRAFYTCLGHANVVFDNDPQIKQLITGAIMWAVRRDHLIK